MASRRQCLRALPALGWLGLAALPGCGFRLRGSALALPFQSLRLAGLSDGALARSLKPLLAGSNVRVVDAPAAGTPPPDGPAPDADVVLEILEDRRERAVVGTTAAGQVREIQLRVRVRVRLRHAAGRELIGETELLEERDLSFTETQVLGKQAEEDLLYREMQAALAAQVMRRLSALRAI